MLFYLSCGISENIISKLQNISTGISTYSISKETYFPQVNMQPLQVGNSLESYFLFGCFDNSYIFPSESLM